jgi:serine/threonine-protein kinase RsbW
VSTIRLRMPARPEYLVLGRLALTGISRVQPMDPDDLGDLKLALTEACSNSMRHAYAGSDGTVDIRIDVAPDAIRIEVRDAGPGFERPQTPREPGELDEGGLGLAIIEAIADEVDIGRGGEPDGSCVRFVKRLRPVARD